ncbi:DUF4012 domain-containing protein [Isoptericola sp. NEAU-Y5]|uniref:DUF4012 domain-containing protein n=1 Tax=Isoptericola luteus TaxID=2879484 RepID=A0ABS7ZDK7_9MICO|nr:DUF4012 domain-containing protein [Isoptericola sp. NEAU-Y5]MCA5893008.1 DUF4012 domain-containing protein [Isoptericola sp. NEAU-Y5]
MTHPGWGEKWAEAPVPVAGTVTRPPDAPPPPRPRLSVRGRAVRKRRVRVGTWVIAALALVLVLTMARVATDALRARDSLAQAADRISALTPAAVAGQTDRVDTILAALQDDTAAAVGATSGPHWWLAERMPFLGSTAEAVTTLAEVSDSLARGPLEDLVSVTGAVNPATLTPRDGRVDLAPLRAAAPAVVDADRDLEIAQQTVAGIDDTLLPQVDGAVASVAAKLGELRSTTATAARAAQLVPAMLGADGERRYLVLVQTNAEPRTLGGIPGSYIQLRADDGEVTIEDQRAASSLGRFDEPVLPLDDAESALFGDKLARFGQNVTMTPDFPRAAELAREMWRLRTGVTVDGVLSMDPVALAAVLAGSDPLTVPGGRELQGDDLSEFLLHDVYLQHPDPSEQDAVFAAVAQSAFERVMRGAAGTSALMDALAGSAREGRVMLWSATPEEQALLDGTVLDGALRGVRGEDTPVVGVYTQMTRAAKMGWYLESDVDVDVVADRPDGSHELAVTVSFTNTATPHEVRGLPAYVTGMDEGQAGELRMNALVYAPAGGKVVSAYDAAGNVGLFPQMHHHLVVGARTLSLSPGETNSVTYVMITGKHQSGDVALRATPGARAQR